ncbi:aminotransferase class III-fold pyridoxal phosphate-dependent enzyme [Pendulispora brunnea]|uniref:Aminotransferase class III-fold pyridoxal phosphate-dependent enzyme n=1 Tax=Pendulispora brunnea TaxID=2905690 RepID=A0ABZ2KGI0_9BACT
MSLSDAQKKYLNQFVDAYVSKSRASRERREQGWPKLADPRSSSGFSSRLPPVVRDFWLATKRLRYPLVGVRCEGAYVWDLDGNRYTDFAFGFGVHLFGHRPKFLVDAITERVAQGTPMGFQSETAAEVAAAISNLTGDERVAFSNTGTEAVMTATRLARAATGRSKIVVFADSYHGSHDDVVSAIDFTLGIAPNHLADSIVLKYGDPKSLETIEQRADEIAAVLVEPVQARHPELQPAAFLHELRAITARRGIVLVFDDVLLGFRVHQGGSQAYFDIRADLATYGKVIGGGMPIGIIAGKPEYMNLIDGGPWQFDGDEYPKVDKIWFAGTFNKNPLTMATTKAMVERLTAEGPALQEGLNRRAAALTDGLGAWLETEGFPIRIARYGSMFKFVMPPHATLLIQHLHMRGIFTWEGMVFFLSPAHSDADLASFEDAVKDSLLTMRKGGYLV